MSSFSSDIGREEEDGGGWDHLLPSLEEREEERRDRNRSILPTGPDKPAPAPVSADDEIPPYDEPLRSLMERAENHVCPDDGTTCDEIIIDLIRAVDDAWEKLRPALADVARLTGELADEEKRGNLHADLNRRAFEALGSRTPEGTLDTWHDIPERITALKAERDAARAAAEAARELADAADTVGTASRNRGLVATQGGRRFFDALADAIVTLSAAAETFRARAAKEEEK